MSDNAPTTIHTNLPRARSPQFREVYSNVSMTQLSAFDITILFQKTSEIMPGQSAIVDEVAVIFSPQQFKALVRALTETIKGFEEVFGPLSIPDMDTAPKRTAAEIADSIRQAREITKK